jgi:hypothetical protein
MMPNPPRILIVEDDPDAGRLLAFFIRRRIPSARIEIQIQPHIEEAFDVYILDNDFAGRRLAGALAERARYIAPNALIVACSGVLDIETLKELISYGCGAVCDKSEPADVDRTLDVIVQYLTSKSASRGVGGIFVNVKAIASLLKEWNARLEAQERTIGGNSG